MEISEESIRGRKFYATVRQMAKQVMMAFPDSIREGTTKIVFLLPTVIPLSS